MNIKKRTIFRRLRPAVLDTLGQHLSKIKFPSCMSFKSLTLSVLQIGNFKDHSTDRPFFEPKLEELLNRPAIDVNLDDIKEQLQGKVVLITGGGGSIGGELCRQILTMNPEKLLILDHSELNLYLIDCELKESKTGVEIQTILADIKDLPTMKNVFNTFRPEFIYHAAAYKHVHLVEKNAYSSIINNIVGTRNLIDCSLEFNVDTFVMISTDKAVNPSSIMGATKRVCELLITNAANSSGHRYCSVRFGNVLGSSGSLIPLLKKQVYAGGPITITHPDMTRYFMLIPEAVKLVLKAGHISNPGDVNILRMGEPVKIMDIAKKVITLMGRTEKEIGIEFIGKRPGEKLFEELYLCGNENPTEHQDIMVLPNGDSIYDSSIFNGQDLRTVIAKLINYSINQDERALEILNRLVFMHERKANDLKEVV